MRIAATAALAVLISTPLSIAQTTAPAQQVKGPIKRVTYDLTTGTFKKGQQKASNIVVYDNTAFLGSAYLVTPGEYVQDTGTLAASNHNCVTDIEFGYATSSATPVDVTLKFHSSAVGCGASPGTLEKTLALTGLPASDGVALVGWSVSVDLVPSVDLFELPDGDIGYSYETTDGLTGPLLVGPPNETGVGDFFGVYDSGSDANLSCSWFGGAPNPFASFYMKLEGHQTTESFGAGCAGNGGIVPTLAITGCAAESSSITFEIADAEGGAGTALMISNATGNFTLPNCTLDIAFPALQVTIVGFLPGVGAGAGAISLPAILPPSGAAGVSVYIQALIRDSVAGVITTNGAALHIAP